MHIPRVVASPSVLQYLEVGFVEHDAMPSLPAGTRMTAQVFNREVMVTLAKYGWSPGSTYGDTMHFDFIEGSDVVPGGRSQANMKHDHFGPKGAQ